MGLVCEIFRIDSLEADRLLLESNHLEELVDELERKYNVPNTNQSVLFHIDKQWKECFEIIEKYLETDYKELKNTLLMIGLSKVIPSKKVSQLDKALNSLDMKTVSKIDIFRNNNLGKDILMDGITVVKRAFNKASSKNQGIIISIG